MSNLIACLRAENQLFHLRACKAFREEWDLEAKFNIVAARLRAEPLGWCPLGPKIEYPIEKIERVTGDIVTVAVRSNMPYLTYYVLPRLYADMVTLRDIQINSGRVRYTIIRAVKKCGPKRIRFDLQLRRV